MERVISPHPTVLLLLQLPWPLGGGRVYRPEKTKLGEPQLCTAVKKPSSLCVKPVGGSTHTPLSNPLTVLYKEAQ